MTFLLLRILIIINFKNFVLISADNIYLSMLYFPLLSIYYI